MIVCTNFRREVPSDKSVCPNCGQPIATNASWPPTPNSPFVPTPPDPGALITGTRWGDLWVGFIANWVLVIILIIGLNAHSFDQEMVISAFSLVLAHALYFGARTIRPTFARGFGFGLLSFVVIALGAVAICISFVS